MFALSTSPVDFFLLLITHPRPTWSVLPSFCCVVCRAVPSAPKVTPMHHVFATDYVFFGAVALTKPFERKRIKATGCYKQYFKFIKIVILF